MRVSVLGNGLTGLTLAQSLVNQGVKVDIFSEKNISNANKIQTIGISEKNIDFFNKNILNIKKYLWNIEKIEIYSDNLTTPSTARNPGPACMTPPRSIFPRIACGISRAGRGGMKPC